MTRSKVGWLCQIAPVDGGGNYGPPIELELWSFWSVQSDPLGKEAAEACAAIHTVKTREKYLPVSATQIEEPSQKPKNLSLVK